MREDEKENVKARLLQAMEVYYEKFGEGLWPYGFSSDERMLEIVEQCIKDGKPHKPEPLPPNSCL
jgi:hypothetical protein